MTGGLLDNHSLQTTPEDQEVLLNSDDIVSDCLGKIDDVEATGTVFSGVLNLANTIIGAGLLGLPYAVANTGLVSGLFLFIFCGGFAAFGLHLLGSLAREFPDSSFYILAEKSIPRYKFLVDLTVAVKCFGVATSYPIVVGDLMPPAMHYFGVEGTLATRRFWITVMMACLTVPTVAFRKLDFLKYASSFSLICLAISVVVIFMYAFDDSLDPCDGVEGKCPMEMRMAPKSGLKLLSVFPIYIFGYTCHQNIFSISNELKNNTPWRLNQVIIYAIGVCITCYALVAYVGYRTYGQILESESDILKVYPESSYTSVVRILFSINLSLSYALLAHPCRNSCSTLLFGCTAYKLDAKRFHMLTWTIVLASFGITMVCSDLGLVLGLVGATGSTAVSWVFPGIFYYSMRPTGKKRLIALGMFITGCCLIPLGVTIEILNAMNKI